MGRHTPSAEELESAIAVILEKASNENLAAKEVRNRLQKDHEAWKVPGERRIAKFIKRQDSSFKKTKKPKKDLFRMFKGDRDDNSQTQQVPAPPEGHPSRVDEKHQKGGLKKSIARVLSPSGRSSRKSRTKKTSFEKFQKFKDETSIKFISEIEESEKPFDEPEKPVIASISEIEDSENAHEVLQLTPKQPTVSPTSSARSSISKSPPITPEEEEIVTADTKDTVESTGITKKLSVVEEAYDDDNDGKKDKCECAGCAIM